MQMVEMVRQKQRRNTRREIIFILASLPKFLFAKCEFAEGIDQSD